MCRLIIAGSRSIIDYPTVKDAVDRTPFKPTLVLCGGASGVDALGARWAFENRVPLKYYRADWKLHGRGAGPIRNTQMAENADALVAIWDGKSPGTRHMIETAARKGLQVVVVNVG